MADFSLGEISGKEYFIQDSNADGIYQPAEDKLLVKQGSKKAKPTELKAPDPNFTRLTGLTEIPKGTSIKTLQSYCEHLERAANAAATGKAEIMENEIKRAYHVAETSLLANYIDGDYQTLLRKEGFDSASTLKRAEAQRYLTKGDLVMFEGALAMANIYARKADIPIVDPKKAQAMKEKALKQLPKLAQRGEVAQVEYGIDMTLRAATANTEILPREKVRFMQVNRQRALKRATLKEFKLAHQAAQKGKLTETNKHLDLALHHAMAVKVPPNKKFAVLKHNIAIIHTTYVEHHLGQARSLAKQGDDLPAIFHLNLATTHAKKHRVAINPKELSAIYSTLARTHLDRAAALAKHGNIDAVKLVLTDANANLAKANNQALTSLRDKILLTAYGNAMGKCLQDAMTEARLGESGNVLAKIKDAQEYAKSGKIPSPNKEIARINAVLNQKLAAISGTDV
ncbi:MAG: hypothetical protein HYU97_07330 [Deltaproteobacteria bacterium]|nr:hypothetical protein [Deltaproteobacteria bacterium]